MSYSAPVKKLGSLVGLSASAEVALHASPHSPFSMLGNFYVQINVAAVAAMLMLRLRISTAHVYIGYLRSSHCATPQVHTAVNMQDVA